MLAAVQQCARHSISIYVLISYPDNPKSSLNVPVFYRGENGDT